jgi:hypothetical protein
VRAEKISLSSNFPLTRKMKKFLARSYAEADATHLVPFFIGPHQRRNNVKQNFLESFQNWCWGRFGNDVGKYYKNKFSFKISKAKI